MEKSNCKICIWSEQCNITGICSDFYSNEDLFAEEYNKDLHMRQKEYEELLKDLDELV